MTISAPVGADSSSLTKHLFSRRDQIPHRQDVLWRIELGVVRTVTWSEEGTIMALGYWGSGDIIGYSLSQILPYQIQCLTSVETSVLPSDIWATEVDAIVLHIQQVEELLSTVHRKPTSLRLWQFLVLLGQKFGRDVERGRLIDLELTHQEIAEAINTTRVSVTRMLQQLESEGMLLRHQRRFVLCRCSST